MAALNDKVLWYNDSYSFNSTDFDFGFNNPEEARQKLQQAVIFKILIAITTLGIVANAFQIGCLCRKKKRTTFDFVVLSLSISDLLISMTFLSQYVFMLFPEKWLAFAFGKSFMFVTMPSVFSVFASFFHAIFIAVQRICAVAFPLRVKRLLSRRRCIIVILCIWTISVGISIAFAFGTSMTAATARGYIMILSICLLIVLYSILLVIIKGKPAIQMQRREQSNRRGMIYSFALMFVFVCCVLPFAIDQLDPFKDFDTAIWFNRISLLVFSCNPLFDSILYFFITFCRSRNMPLASNEVEQTNVTRSEAEKTNSTSL